MLVALNVKNFAIIDNINVEFKDGMTVLTGETGAGKSLIIDAIGLLFGKRASSEMIRSGEDKATIEGSFSDYDSEITKILDEIGIDYRDEAYLTIKREIYASGKSVCKINNQTCNLGQLAQISEFIGDIHSQEDTIGLINPKNYLRLLNNAKVEELLKGYAEKYQEYKKDLDSNKLDEVVQKRAPMSDKSGDEHYNLISAVHKSLRSSDTDAALYWVARMITSGQDPRYVLRRLTRFAMEDVGLADPNAMQIALSAWQIYERMGSPEGDIALTELVIYLATAPKSISAYKAQNVSYSAARATGSLMPPKNILNAPTKMMKNLGYGDGYVYDPETETGCSGQNCFPDGMERVSFYKPVERGFEREIKKRFDYWNSFRKKNN